MDNFIQNFDVVTDLLLCDYVSTCVSVGNIAF